MKVRGAIMVIKEPKAFTENFKKQDIYLDTSNYNNMTGEKYANYTLVENVNDKIDLQGFEVGDVVDVEFYLNGRFYDRKDNLGKGFGQSLSAFKIEAALNTAGEKIKMPLDQMDIQETPA